MQRKDTPAARAALARRRQRAAQNLKTAPTGDGSSITTASTNKTTTTKTTTTTTKPPVQQIANNTLSAANDVRTKSKLPPSSTTHRPKEKPQPTTSTRQSIRDVRTDTAGTASTPSTEGLMKTEVVFASSQSEETFEKISSFGSVKITSPQPVTVDRRTLPRYPASPKRTTAPVQSKGPQLETASVPKQQTPLPPAVPAAVPKPQPKPSVGSSAIAKPKVEKSIRKPIYNRATSPNRISRIPSKTKTINSNTNRLLPRRRSPSPRRAASPQRFQAPSRNNPSEQSKSNIRNKSPQRSPPANTSTSRATNNTMREKLKPRLRKPGPETSVAGKPAAATSRRSVSPFRQYPPSKNEKEDLSALLNDSSSIADASLVLDPAMQQSQRGGKAKQLSPRPKQKSDDTSTSSPFVIRQNVSFATPEMKKENDSHSWNVRPQQQQQQANPKFSIQGPLFKSPTKQTNGQSQIADAACLNSGDFVMVRSCSTHTTLHETNGFQGLGLGKENETLRIVKAGGFTPILYGDVVILESLSNQSKRVLGARNRRNHGDNEIAFLDANDVDSSRWMVRSAQVGTSIVVGRSALLGENLANEIESPVKSGSSIVLLNCSNGGILSILDGVAILRTDSYDPSRTTSLIGRHNDRFEPSVSECFQFVKMSTPPCPTWVTPGGLGERFFLNGSYLKEPLRNPIEPMMVDEMLTLKSKETILVDEVIGSFLGLEGVYVKLKESGEQDSVNFLQKFHLLDGQGMTFDLSLRNLVEQILPLSTSYVRVRDFIGQHYPGYEYGRVMQAFCEGLDVFLKQFVSFVAQLEHKVRSPAGALTMKNIHFEITPLLHSMSILENTTKTVYDKKGGALINALRSLEKSMYMGDTVAKDLLGQLLDRASVPYAETLSIWLQSGRLHDPYQEFMVKKTEKVEIDGDTWAELFTFNEEHVIHDIVRNDKSKTKILVTGKYWNAVQACIVDNTSSFEETKPRTLEMTKLQFQSDLSGISAYIESMYESASSELMHILRDKFHLRESLQVMKRYFLLDQGDFLANFLDASGQYLSKPVEEVSIGRVQHLLGNSIQLTESQRESDSFNTKFGGSRRKLSPSSLRCRLAEQSLVSYLDSLYGGFDDRGPVTPSRTKYGAHLQGKSGFDFFEIDFIRIPFPISLLISPNSMENYKLLFRHLFFAKHVERRLVGVWSDHQVLKKLDALRGLLGPTFLLRQRMQHCVQNLMNYMSFEIVESNWLEMISSIDLPENAMLNEKQQTVDDLLEIHDGFLQKTMDSCLLTNPVLIKTLIKLLNTCLLFTDQMKRFMDTTKIYDDQFSIAAEKRRTVQRNLNERIQSPSKDQKKLRKSLMLVKEERDILLQRQTRRVGREICSESYKRMIFRFEEVFSADLAVFMRQLNNHASSGMVTNLGIRLDWNGYVSQKMSSVP